MLPRELRPVGFASILRDMKFATSTFLIVFLAIASGCCLMKRGSRGCAGGLCEQSQAEPAPAPAANPVEPARTPKKPAK